MGNCFFQEIRGGLEICVEDSNKLKVLDIAAIHCRLEIPRLVPVPDNSVPVDNTGTILLPFQHLLFDQHLGNWVI